MKVVLSKIRYFAIFAFIILFLGSCSQDTSNGHITAGDVYISFSNNGLEAANPHVLTSEDIYLTGSSCTGAFFYIPSLGSNDGGRILECETSSGLNGLVNNIVNIDNYQSWLVVKMNILVQIDGRLPEAIANRYAAAIPGIGASSIRPPNSNSQMEQPIIPTITPIPTTTITEQLLNTSTVAIYPSVTPLPTATNHICGSICQDGSLSDSTGSGTCSHHGGVRGPRYCNK